MSRIVRPTSEEFEVDGNVVTHVPTDAKWTA
jgi:hypothetical protein